mmetsp:Transcript_11614/g.27292  ORF Transcript_11614/g.27292 Transcript_11614/m.27292 type:complete len:365 (-) Transcript_11614:165-1259(-)
MDRELLGSEGCGSVLSNAQLQELAKALVDRARANQGKEGTDWVMFFGTTNAIFLAWVFGVYPEHVWLVFCVEGLLLFALRLRNVCKAKAMALPGGGTQVMFRLLYLVEFCYVASYTGIVVAAVLLFDPPWFTPAVARKLFATGFGVSGSLLGAAAAFRNQLLFHDVDNTVSVFIHFCPAMVCFTMRWHYDRLHSAWPTIFHRGPFNDIPLVEIWLSAATFYGLWLVPYACWMLVSGRTLPQRKSYDTCFRLNPDANIAHDTIFHFNLRDTVFGRVVQQARRCDAREWQRKCRDHGFSAGDVCVYLLFHTACNTLGPCFSLLLYTSPELSGIALAVVLVLAIHAGSGRYGKMIHISNEVLKMQRL